MKLPVPSLAELIPPLPSRAPGYKRLIVLTDSLEAECHVVEPRLSLSNPTSFIAASATTGAAATGAATMGPGPWAKHGGYRMALHEI